MYNKAKDIANLKEKIAFQENRKQDAANKFGTSTKEYLEIATDCNIQTEKLLHQLSYARG